MAKRKRNNILIIILAIALGVYLINYMGFFDEGLPGLAIVPITLDQGIQTTSPYYCPQESDSCQVRATMNCDVLESNQEPRVIIRTNGFGEDMCVGYDWDNDGDLDPRRVISRGDDSGFTGDSDCRRFTTQWIRSDGLMFMINDEFNLYIKNNNGDCWETRNSGTYRFDDCGVSPSIIPQSSCYTPEICEGEPSRYECSAEVRLNDEIQENLFYTSLSSGGSRTSSQYTLNPGDKFEIIGGDSIEIGYLALRNEERCYSDYCQGNGYIPCIDEFGNPVLEGELGFPDSDNFEACQYGCDNGKCLDPYNVKIELKDANGFPKESFAKGDEVKIYVTIETPSVISGDLTLSIRESTIQGPSIFSETRTFSANELQIFTTNIDYTDSFYIVLAIDYPVLQEPDIYGIEQGEFTSFNIVDQFTANLRFTQTIGGVDVSNEFYTGYPIKIEYIFQEPGQTPILPDSAIVTYNGNPLTLSSQFTDDENGYNVYLLLTETPGLYEISAKATKGLYTTPESRQSMNIKRDQVVLDYDISHNPVKNNQPYTNILTFTTENRNGDLIETTNTVTILIRGVESGNLPVKGSGGQYSVDYNFLVPNADYSFVINSIPSGNLVPSEIQTILINSGSDDEEFCNSNDDCGFLGVCSNGNCETNTTMVFALVGGVFLLLIIGIVAFRFFKKKREPDLGGLGL